MRKLLFIFLFFIFVIGCENEGLVKVSLHEINLPKDDYDPTIGIIVVIENFSDSCVYYSLPRREEEESTRDTSGCAFLSLPCSRDLFLFSHSYRKNEFIESGGRDGFVIIADMMSVLNAMSQCSIDSIGTFNEYLIKEGKLTLRLKSFKYSSEFKLKEQNIKYN